MSIPIKKLLDENDEQFYPVTHLEAVRDENGRTVLDLVGDGDLIAAAVSQNGFYFVDEDLNIGAFVDALGVHAPNILEHELVND